MTAAATGALPRFYKRAETEAQPGGHRVLLDGKPVSTPCKSPLLVPSATLAEAVAAEWEAQGARIRPETMPITRLANAALDLVRGREAAVVDDIVAYAGSDLICYRAEAPVALVAAQAARWDPVLAWAAHALGARFRTAEGVIHVSQERAALARLRAAAEALDHFRLAALHTMTTLSGSALIALAHLSGALSVDDAWAAALVDEDWQIARWGEDADAMVRRGRRRAEFDAAARLVALLDGHGENRGSPP